MNLQNCRVLVTGADGFIGSHLVESLVEAGASVRALACYNSFNSWGWLDTVPCLNRIEVISGDIRDPHFCTVITKDIDIIFHLAALIAIPYSYKAPDSYVDTNIKGTVNICQSALANGVKRVLHTSTSEVYGTARYVPIDEHHPLTPQSPYSASKIGADAMALSFHYAFGLPVTVVRPFNRTGPAVCPGSDFHDHLATRGRQTRDRTGRHDYDPRFHLCHRHVPWFSWLLRKWRRVRRSI